MERLGLNTRTRRTKESALEDEEDEVVVVCVLSIDSLLYGVLSGQVTVYGVSVIVTAVSA